MIRTVLAACLALPLMATSAMANELDEEGTLNPEELTMNSIIGRAMQGEAEMVTCMHVYFAIKAGNHTGGREILKACREKFTAAMHWQSYADTNGLGGPEDAEEAARWDRKAAERGDPVGQFNHGLNLLRGYGVAKNETAGRHWIDRSAASGFETAQELKSSDYNPDVVTPDADNWRFDKDKVW